MKKKFIVILFMIPILSSMIFSKKFDFRTYVNSQITTPFIKKMKNEKGLVLLGFGGGLMSDVENIGIDFDTYQILDLDLARKLFVETKEKLRDIVNRDKRIRPYLREYPFPADRVEIVIASRQPVGNSKLSDNITFIHSHKGKISYFKHDFQSDKFNKDIIVYEEDYNEAKKIVFGNCRE